MPALPANGSVWGSGGLEWAKEGASNPHQETKIHRVTTTSVLDPGHVRGFHGVGVDLKASTVRANAAPVLCRVYLSGNPNDIRAYPDVILSITCSFSLYTWVQEQ